MLDLQQHGWWDDDEEFNLCGSFVSKWYINLVWYWNSYKLNSIYPPWNGEQYNPVNLFRHLFHINHYSKSVSNVALLQGFHCSYKAVPLLRFFLLVCWLWLLCHCVLSLFGPHHPVLFCHWFFSSSFLLLDTQEGCGSCLWPFLGSFIYIYACTNAHCCPDITEILFKGQ